MWSSWSSGEEIDTCADCGNRSQEVQTETRWCGEEDQGRGHRCRYRVVSGMADLYIGVKGERGSHTRPLE